MKTPVKEQILDIKSIAHFIVGQDKKPVRDLKYKDFIDKCNKISKTNNMSLEKEDIDIVIFTSNIMELNAFNTLLSFRDTSSKEYKNINGLRVWKTTIKRSNNKSLKVILLAICEAGNVSCTLACMRIFDFFNVKFSIFSGIAAGLKPKYSVVFSEGIVDYEHQRLELDNIVYRPDPVMINDKGIKRCIQYYLEKSEMFKAELKQSISKYSINYEEFDTSMLDLASLNFGIIASGEKLFADGLTLEKLSKKIVIDKGIIAGEMEGYGFTNSCNEFKIPWIVVRGISDDGGVEKDKPLNKKYQFVAALSASIATIQFLKYEYRNNEDYDVF